MKKKKQRGVSDSNLNLLWRKTVLAVHENKCFFCGSDANIVDIECHHYAAKRKNFLLRWDWRNGIPVCKWVHKDNEKFKMSCHQYAETWEGRQKIADYAEQYSERIVKRSMTAKQWFVEHGITKQDYKAEMYTDLTVTWALTKTKEKELVIKLISGAIPLRERGA